MNLIRRLRTKVARRLDGNPFAKNLGWLGLSQVFIRISRLAATFILARFLTKEDYGLAALVLTTYEFSMTFTRIGINAKVIQATDDEVEEMSESAYWLNWTLYGGLFLLQCAVAFPVAWFYQNDKLIWPICVLSLAFLVAPIGRVQSSLLQRDNNMKAIAVARSIRYSTANVMTAVLAVLGMGMWAIVLPRLLAAPLEFIVYLMKNPWRPQRGFTTKNWGKIFKFGINILGIQLLQTFRENVDYLIIGRFIGITELGIYYFAYNAGLGISLTIIQSVTTALYPHLCAARESVAQLKSTFLKSLKTIAVVIVPFVALQSSLAPIYVPIVFGEQWVPAIPVLILICLSAIPRPFATAASSLLASVDRPQVGLVWDLTFTIVFTLSILLGVSGEALGVATAVLVAHIILVPIFVFGAMRYVFHSRFKPI